MAGRQLEHAQQQPEILLIQRAMAESSRHIEVIIEKPHLRPYFYDGKLVACGGYDSTVRVWDASTTVTTSPLSP